MKSDSDAVVMSNALELLVLDSKNEEEDDKSCHLNNSAVLGDESGGVVSFATAGMRDFQNHEGGASVGKAVADKDRGLDGGVGNVQGGEDEVQEEKRGGGKEEKADVDKDGERIEEEADTAVEMQGRAEKETDAADDNDSEDSFSAGVERAETQWHTQSKVLGEAGAEDDEEGEEEEGAVHQKEDAGRRANPDERMMKEQWLQLLGSAKTLEAKGLLAKLVLEEFGGAWTPGGGAAKEAGDSSAANPEGLLDLDARKTVVVRDLKKKKKKKKANRGNKAGRNQRTSAAEIGRRREQDGAGSRRPKSAQVSQRSSQIKLLPRPTSIALDSLDLSSPTRHVAGLSSPASKLLLPRPSSATVLTAVREHHHG